MANYKAHLSVRDDVRPRFNRARQVQFAMRDAVVGQNGEGRNHPEGHLQ